MTLNWLSDEQKLTALKNLVRTHKAEQFLNKARFEAVGDQELWDKCYEASCYCEKRIDAILDAVAEGRDLFAPKPEETAEVTK